MGRGLFTGTFYTLQEPLYVDRTRIQLNNFQVHLVQGILATERMQHLLSKLGAIGDGIIYHKDHYEYIILLFLIIILYYISIISFHPFHLMLYIFVITLHPLTKLKIYFKLISSQD